MLLDMSPEGMPARLLSVAVGAKVLNSGSSLGLIGALTQMLGAVIAAEKDDQARNALYRLSLTSLAEEVKELKDVEDNKVLLHVCTCDCDVCKGATALMLAMLTIRMTTEIKEQEEEGLANWDPEGREPN